jgi:D-aminoacyl-tRNA deacylase
MRVVIQRVTSAKVEINKKIVGEINHGFLILVGVENDDTEEDVDWLVQKIINLRVFNDAEGKMNLSVLAVQGQLLVVSQFTLQASTLKGNRPSFLRAAKPERAIQLYTYFIAKAQEYIHSRVQTGEFGADMQISLTNDGPVTILIDSKNKE